ncbi:hypothetical protein ECL_05022 [Enterobacter cloacae subsp. cloacae ATCC 13047]|uniref:Uncharacterized protein n=1 Tax=Enterobacter cloacae subsp. cloacae (strain ATCC 13047 / DSM 30054 / NBRC 13535 / NCTC 10005 / WDCM 00083 / NCDC 279-56) TaxID=716541 RepID=A0A0H3CTH6_ENTCC|nr:hypothetical protein ECL_05022 [Enterobacter cloacae subsp. cloacae ATCC 13047]
MPQASSIARDDETKCDVIPAGLRAGWRFVDEDFPFSQCLQLSSRQSLPLRVSSRFTLDSLFTLRRPETECYN